MTRKKKSKRISRKHNANQKLAVLFKMSREQLRAFKTTGGGVHQTDPRTMRPVASRNAVLSTISLVDTRAI